MKTELAEYLGKVKWAFYFWMGALTIDELLRNRMLVEALERVDSKFRRVEAAR